MALVYLSRAVALDSAGNPIVGATLTVYDAGTTTPASIYRDSALTTPMTNPTSGSDVSDSAGRFRQIFATEGATFDITLKTSGGVVIEQELSVPALGAGGGNITRDYGSSRLLIRGSAGRVYFEGGDPSGDDVGGKVTVGGYNGTQADDMVLNSAAVTIGGTVNTGSTLNSGGLITENSKRLSGVVSSYGTAAAAASIIVPLANSPAGFTAYDIDLSNIFVSAGPLSVTFSYDNGATYVVTSNYATSTDGTTASGQVAGSLLGSVSTVTPIAARLRMMTGDAGGGGGNLMSYLYGMIVNTTPHWISIAYQAGALFRVTHVKIVSGGTITGNWRVIPLRGSGEA